MDVEKEGIHLAKAEEQLRLAQEHVARQARVVEKLRMDGHDASEAATLLRTFLDALTVAEELLQTRKDLLRRAELETTRQLPTGTP